MELCAAALGSAWLQLLVWNPVKTTCCTVPAVSACAVLTEPCEAIIIACGALIRLVELRAQFSDTTCTSASLLDHCCGDISFHGLQGLKRERREAASAAKEQKNSGSKGETVMEGLELHTAE